MFRILKKSLLTGIVTSNYPKEPDPAPEGFRGRPEVDFEKCTGCKVCSEACPSEAITYEDDLKQGIRNWQLSYAHCIFCGACEEQCPYGAITLSRFYEMASRNKDDLFVMAKFQLSSCPHCGQYFETIREIQRTSKEVSHGCG
jgi:hydrogenase-4 component H